MSRKLATILLGFFIVTAVFGPRLVLANSEPIHSSCHETSKEMPTICAIHCLTTAINENEVNFNLTPITEFFVPIVFEDFLISEVSPSTQLFFEKATVFRDAKTILTTIKRE